MGGGCRGQEPEALRRSPKYQREVVGIRTEGRERGATTAGARDGPATWGPEVRLVLASVLSLLRAVSPLHRGHVVGL